MINYKFIGKHSAERGFGAKRMTEKEQEFKTSEFQSELFCFLTVKLYTKVIISLAL